MVAKAGRQVVFTWGSASPPVEIAGVREKGIELNGEPIDITSDENDGWRTLLSLPAENQVNVSLSGVTKDRTLITDWFAGTRTREATFTYPDGSILQGEFFLATFNDTAVYNEAVAFEASLQSTGVVTFTPGA